VKDVKDLVAQLKAKPTSTPTASGRQRHRTALRGRLFQSSCPGVVMLGVPYKGSAPAISDTIGGQTQFMFPSLFTALPHVKGGKRGRCRCRAEALDPAARRADAERGRRSDGVDVQQWYGFFPRPRRPSRSSTS